MINWRNKMSNFNNLYEKKEELLKEAIKDTQSIIAMLDLKARFLLAVILAILGAVLVITKEIFFNKNSFFINNTCVWVIVFLIFGYAIYLVYIIYRLIFDVLNPRNNPKDVIEKIPHQYDKSPFFPVPDRGKFDFSQWKEIINTYDKNDLLNLYLYELLKVSYIRHLKLTNLNTIIETHIRNALIFLIIFGIMIIIVFTIYYFCKIS
jgi:hypothetical protein